MVKLLTLVEAIQVGLQGYKMHLVGAGMLVGAYALHQLGENEKATAAVMAALAVFAAAAKGNRQLAELSEIKNAVRQLQPPQS